MNTLTLNQMKTLRKLLSESIKEDGIELNFLYYPILQSKWTRIRQTLKDMKFGYECRDGVWKFKDEQQVGSLIYYLEDLIEESEKEAKCVYWQTLASRATVINIACAIVASISAVISVVVAIVR